MEMKEGLEKFDDCSVILNAAENANLAILRMASLPENTYCRNRT